MNDGKIVALPRPGASSRIAGRVMSDIYAGRLGSGTRLPAAPQLATTYHENVAAVPIAVAWLEAYGLLVRAAPEEPLYVVGVTEAPERIAADQMIALILREEWVPGSRVPVEDDLARMVETEPTVVATAVEVVARAGLIRRCASDRWRVVIRYRMAHWVTENLARDAQSAGLTAAKSFPSLDEIASEFGVSRESARRAIAQLIRTRRAVRRWGRDVVAPPGPMPDDDTAAPDLARVQVHARGEVLRDRAIGTLLLPIVNGELAPGTVLPSSKALAGALKMSVPTVVAAEAWLVSHGVLIADDIAHRARVGPLPESGKERVLRFIYAHVLSATWEGGRPVTVTEWLDVDEIEVRAAVQDAISLGLLRSRGPRKQPTVAVAFPAAAAIADAVGAAIDAGTVRPRGLVSVSTLHDSFGVGMHVAREAHRQLVQQGYLVPCSGRIATMVAPRQEEVR